MLPKNISNSGSGPREPITIMSILPFLAKVTIASPTLLLNLLVPVNGMLFFCKIDWAFLIISLLFCMILFLTVGDFFTNVGNVYTFKPIMDNPDCLDMSDANFKPLREFLEPSNGTKILCSFLLTNTN